MSTGNIPPPPPPPPMPAQLNNMGSSNQTANSTQSSNIAPPLPPPPQNNQIADSGRSALLDQIRQGKKLNKVDPTKETGSSNNCGNTNQSSAGECGRDALLDQIRRGVKLNSVEKNPTEKPAPTLNTSGLAGALAKALQERSRVLQHTDESSSDSSELEDEDDWDE